MKDEMILAAISAKDEDAMSRVINQFSQLLWPIAGAVLKNVGSVHDVEECVADAFIYLWEHPEKFDLNRGSLKTALCIVARSRAIDRYRQICRRSTVPLEEAALSEGFGFQEELLREETRRELLAAIRALGEPGREILVRRYYYNQKPREISLALGLTVKQVNNFLYRAKRQLRDALKSGEEALL